MKRSLSCIPDLVLVCLSSCGTLAELHASTNAEDFSIVNEKETLSISIGRPVPVLSEFHNDKPTEIQAKEEQNTSTTERTETSHEESSVDS